MRVRTRALFLLAAIPLAGCYTSAEPLITGGTADFPFETAVYFNPEAPDRPRLIRAGDAYAIEGENPAYSVRFDDYGDGFYLIQMIGPTDSGAGTETLYAVAEADLAAGIADLYLMFAEPQMLARGNIPECAMHAGSGCLTDGAQLVDLARLLIAEGAEPDVSLILTEMR